MLPCGAGKTMVGALAAGEGKRRTLIICTNEVAAEQWRDEVRRCTTAEEGSISLFTTSHKHETQTMDDDALTLLWVTITTYAMLAHDTVTSGSQRMQAMLEIPWGLVVLDEVHGAPATTHLRACRKLRSLRMVGLTATLVPSHLLGRTDGC